MRSEAHGAGGSADPELPRMLRIRQRMETARIDDVFARASALLQDAQARSTASTATTSWRSP